LLTGTPWWGLAPTGDRLPAGANRISAIHPQAEFTLRGLVKAAEPEARPCFLLNHAGRVYFDYGTNVIGSTTPEPTLTIVPIAGDVSESALLTYAREF